jgi:hypothetical protein
MGKQEHQRVRLLEPKPHKNLPEGAEGTIVHIYRHGVYEIEFLQDAGRPILLLLKSKEIEFISNCVSNPALPTDS